MAPSAAELTDDDADGVWVLIQEQPTGVGRPAKILGSSDLPALAQGQAAPA